MLLFIQSNLNPQTHTHNVTTHFYHLSRPFFIICIILSNHLSRQTHILYTHNITLKF